MRETSDSNSYLVPGPCPVPETSRDKELSPQTQMHSARATLVVDLLSFDAIRNSV